MQEVFVSHFCSCQNHFIAHVVSGGSVCPGRARSTTFVLNILTFTPGLPSPREAAQIGQSGPQTLPTKHNSIKQSS